MKAETSYLSKGGIILYALAFTLIAFELFVLALTRFPTVSEDYKAYYIARVAPCPPLGKGRKYKLGTKISLTSDSPRADRNYLACMWSRSGPEGTMTGGTHSKLFMSISPSTGDLVLKLGASGFAGGKDNQEVEVSVNDTILTTWTLPSGQSSEVAVTIPYEATQDGDLRVQFRILHPSGGPGHSPSGSANPVGMLAKWFVIEQAKT